MEHAPVLLACLLVGVDTVLDDKGVEDLTLKQLAFDSPIPLHCLLGLVLACHLVHVVNAAHVLLVVVYQW